MKKTLKAFTLVEMIIVVAIFGILMAGLMNFYSPIKQTYADSTMYEKMRTSQNGILEYLCESTRYADNIKGEAMLTMYDEGGVVVFDDGTTKAVTSAKDSVDAFLKEHSIDMTTDKGKELADRIHVIVINRKDNYTSAGESKSTAQGFGSGNENITYKGRIITNIPYIDRRTSPADHASDTTKIFSNTDTGLRTSSGGSSGITYMALGAGYYGASNYQIYIDYAKTFPSDKYAGGITFAVMNSLKNDSGVITDESSIGASSVTLNGNEVELTTVQGNITPSNRGAAADNVHYWRSNSSTANHTAAGNRTSTGSYNENNKNTYIIYILPDEER